MPSVNSDTKMIVCMFSGACFLSDRENNLTHGSNLSTSTDLQISLSIHKSHVQIEIYFTNLHKRNYINTLIPTEKPHRESHPLSCD